MNISQTTFEELKSGGIEFVRIREPQNATSKSIELVLAGSFNPFHEAHQTMAEMAVAQFWPEPGDAGAEPELSVWFELSIANVEKADLDFEAVSQRLSQEFGGPDFGVVVTKASTFEEKLKLFPNATFVIGADTVVRIDDLSFYRDAEHHCQAISAFESKVADRPRFLVFGRWNEEDFVLGQQEISEELASQCKFVSQSEFEMRISSTQIRNQDGLK